MAIKKRAKKKARRKQDPMREMLAFLAKASLNLGAASEKACKLERFDLAEEIIDVAKRSERLEVKISGKPIYRVNG